MAFDLYGDESAARVASLRPVTAPEPGVMDNFLAGSGKVMMQGFAKAGRAVDLLGAVGPILQDRIKGGSSSYNPLRLDWNDTTEQDKYFKEHDEVFGRAVDYWTPKPGEVGAAGEVVGQVLSTLTTAIASPAFTVGSLQLSTAEDLVNKGVSPGKAQAVGAVQAAGLGLGIWMPILGNNLWQRAVLGGAGFNATQGIATRGASQAILSGTPAAEDFKAFDGQSLTLDVVLGLAFGGLAHLSPSQRAQGEAMWKKIADWTGTLKTSDVDAIAALRQAQHLNVDSTPGRPVDTGDIEAHVTAMRQAVDDVLAGRPVNVEDLVTGARFLPDAERAAFQKTMTDELATQARAMIEEGMARNQARADAEATPGFLRTAEQQLALKDPVEAAQVNPDIARAIEIAKKPGFQRTATERLFLDSMLNGRAGDYLLGDVDLAPIAAPRVGESLTPEAAGVEPLQAEASRFVQANPDLQLTIGRNADGTPITASAKQFLEDADAVVKQAGEDAKLFEVAAACMLGAA